MADKIVGVIGGMGPEATVDLMQRVIRATPARDDLDHIRMIVDNNPKIPSRIKAIIEGTGQSPLPVLEEMARNLAALGADFLAIPCNTAHYYFRELSQAVPIPVLNMIHMTVDWVLAAHPSLKAVGMLTSPAVQMKALYEQPFQDRGVAVLYPSLPFQDRILESIRQIKTGRHGPLEKGSLAAAARDLMAQKAQVLIIACTELSLIAEALDSPLPVYDSAQVLAEGIVRLAKGGSLEAANDGDIPVQGE